MTTHTTMTLDDCGGSARELWIMTRKGTNNLPERKSTIDSKGSKRSVRGLPIIQPSVTMNLNGVTSGGQFRRFRRM
jgi:hypothetical protein